MYHEGPPALGAVKGAGGCVVGVQGGPGAVGAGSGAGSATFLRVPTDPASGQAPTVQPERHTPEHAEKAVLQSLAGHCPVPNGPNPVIDTGLDPLKWLKRPIRHEPKQRP